MIWLTRPLTLVFVLTMSLGCGSKKESSTAETPATDVAKAPVKKGPDYQAILRAPEKATNTAPDTFTVKLETTVGDILMDVTRAWSPKGVDRFYNLVQAGYYTDIAFFRVIPGFMAQVGISGDPSLNAAWHRAGIADEPVAQGQSNTRGMVSYAKGGPNTRSTQFFINFGNNSNLDQLGFPPIAKVQATSMATVDKIYSGYGECQPSGRGPSQGRLHREGTAYLKKDFPQLTYIKRASVITAP